MQFIVGDVRFLQFVKKHDLVIASEVLMHILPSEINSVIQKLAGFSVRHIVSVDWYEERPPKKVASHNFMHNYKKYIKKYPLYYRSTRFRLSKRGLLLKVEVKQLFFTLLKFDLCLLPCQAQ